MDRSYLWEPNEWDDDEEAFVSDPSTRAWLETVVERVVLSAAGSSRPTFDPARAEVRLREGVVRG